MVLLTGSSTDRVLIFWCGSRSRFTGICYIRLEKRNNKEKEYSRERKFKLATNWQLQIYNPHTRIYTPSLSKIFSTIY